MSVDFCSCCLEFLLGHLGSVAAGVTKEDHVVGAVRLDRHRQEAPEAMRHYREPVQPRRHATTTAAAASATVATTTAGRAAGAFGAAAALAAESVVVAAAAVT